MNQAENEERTVDVILYFHGTVDSQYKDIFEPQLDCENQELFLVPEKSQIYLYGSLDDDFEAIAQSDDKQKSFMIKKI